MKSVNILALAAAVAALSLPAAFAQAQTGQPVAAADDELKAVKLFVRKNSGDPYPFNGGQIQIGRPVLDAPEVWRKIPAFPQYSFANLGGQLVVIDTATRKVVAIY